MAQSTELAKAVEMFEAARTVGEVQDHHLISAAGFTPRQGHPTAVDLGGEGGQVTLPTPIELTPFEPCLNPV